MVVTPNPPNIHEEKLVKQWSKINPQLYVLTSSSQEACLRKVHYMWKWFSEWHNFNGLFMFIIIRLHPNYYSTTISLYRNFAINVYCGHCVFLMREGRGKKKCRSLGPNQIISGCQCARPVTQNTLIVFKISNVNISNSFKMQFYIWITCLR